MKLNHSQHQALNSLQYNLELVCGPPGTGKSTTILAIVSECVKPGELTIVTAVQNRAIEAIVVKFISSGTPFIVGGRRPIGEACKWTLEAQVDRDSRVVRANRDQKRVMLARATLKAGLKKHCGAIFEEYPSNSSFRARQRSLFIDDLVKKASKGVGHIGRSGLCEFPAYKNWLEDNPDRRRTVPSAQRELKELVLEYVEERVNGWAKLADVYIQLRWPQACELSSFIEKAYQVIASKADITKAEARKRVAESARALVCTSAAVGPALRDVHLSPVVVRTTTVICDESGCIGDRHVLPVVASCPALSRLVLVGDTKQLPVFSYIRDDDEAKKSLMERLEERFDNHILQLQYRMPPKLAQVVSHCFYNDCVQTVPGKRETSDNPIQFISVSGQAKPEREGGTSMINELEAKKAATVATRLVEESPNAAIEPNIAVLCLHAAQRRRVAKLLRHPHVEVLTVDASQGREWDHVVISLVSVEVRGSVTDARRQCVMLSRAKETLTLIGHPEVVALLPALADFRAACVADLIPPPSDPGSVQSDEPLGSVNLALSAGSWPTTAPKALISVPRNEELEQVAFTSSSSGQTLVVLNVANIGHFGSSSSFSWQQVELAFEYYAARMHIEQIQGVLSPHTAHRNPIPRDFPFRARILEVPARHGKAGAVKDIDDMFTIRIAMKHHCHFVDNDNYRDHKRSDSRLDHETRSFLRDAFLNLHVEYVFDSNGAFIPLRETRAETTPSAAEPRQDDCSRGVPFYRAAGLPPTTWRDLARQLEPDELMQTRYTSTLNWIQTLVSEKPLWLVMMPWVSQDARFCIRRIEVAGSFAKDTGTKESADIDVVIQFSHFNPDSKKEYIDCIEQALRAKSKVDMSMSEKTVKLFKFQANGIHVDVLVSGLPCELPTPWPQCLTDMHDAHRESWRAAFHYKGIEFIRHASSRQPLCKAVIRIAKFWAKRVVKKWQAHTMPPSYLLELLVIHGMDFEKTPCTSIESGFTAFLRCIVNYESMWVTWKDWFIDQDVIPHKITTEKPPLVVDPVDPANNVAKTVDHWDELAKVASTYLL